MIDKQEFIKNGYEKLKNKDQLDYLYLLSKKLINQAVEINESVWIISMDYKFSIETIFIQRILHVSFNENILIAFGRNKIKIWLTY